MAWNRLGQLFCLAAVVLASTAPVHAQAPAEPTGGHSTLEVTPPPAPTFGQQSGDKPTSPSLGAPVVQKIQAAHTKLEMTVNGSRILSMDQAIPKAQVANPELLDFTVLSENQVQVHAKKAGITTINLWDENDNIYSIDVVILGDVRELDRLLRTQFPTASIKLYPTAASTLIVFGYVDRADYVNRIIRIAEDFYPKVLNNMVVGGSQQVLLYVKVMQVSRTELRTLGIDMVGVSGQSFGGITPSGLITKGAAATNLARGFGNFTSNGAETLQFGVISNGNGFVAMIEALKQDDLLKVMAEPTLVTVSGRPAQCNVGGEVAYPQPTGFGNISVAFRPFGTQIDFVPIVLGNGTVRLEVRPRVSEVDHTLGTTINGTAVPGFRVREADTGVEMKFGQTLAIAGLLSQEDQAQVRGIPYLMDLPYVGAAFRRTRNRINEVELLITVRPELVEAMDPDQVPPCGPGMNSMAPDDCGLYWKGYREVPIKPPGYGPGDACAVPEGPGGEMLPPPNTPVEEMPPGAYLSRGSKPVVISDRPYQAAAPQAPAARPGRAGAPPAGAPRANPYNSASPQIRKTPVPATVDSAPPGFIGPIGYDVKN